MENYFVHPSTVLSSPLSIGEGTNIWHFSHLMPNVKVGKNCVIGQNCFIGDSVSIGDGVKIQNNVSVYKAVRIENDVFIGPSAVFTNVINPRSFIERKDEFKKTVVKHGASIGANATILCGLTIGKYAFVGAGAVVTKTVKDFSIVAGNPARHRGWMCVCGGKLEKRSAFYVCPECKRKYAKKNKNGRVG